MRKTGYSFIRPFGRHHTLACNRGSAAIEFAIVAPVLVVILAGMLCYSVYFSAASSVQQLAADAARAAVAGLTEEERASIARKRVANAAGSFALIDPSKVQVRANVSASDPEVFVVAVTYDASKLAIWGFANLIPMPSPTIVRSAAIQRGGY